jgi:hypothetical protein
MSTYEIEAQVGPDGAITLRSLPFAEGQHVRIQIEPAGKPISSRTARVWAALRRRLDERRL